MLCALEWCRVYVNGDECMCLELCSDGLMKLWINR